MLMGNRIKIKKPCYKVPAGRTYECRATRKRALTYAHNIILLLDNARLGRRILRPHPLPQSRTVAAETGLARFAPPNFQLTCD